MHFQILSPWTFSTTKAAGSPYFNPARGSHVDTALANVSGDSYKEGFTFPNWNTKSLRGRRFFLLLPARGAAVIMEPWGQMSLSQDGTAKRTLAQISDGIRELFLSSLLSPDFCLYKKTWALMWLRYSWSDVLLLEAKCVFKWQVNWTIINKM